MLIWPELLSERLDDEHVEAILAHEMVHTRRRDNLAAALHMIVEAAFWFHPMVWWMERRMVEERERACDEAEVEMGSKPGIYAESLLKAVRFCVESPLTCVAGITGADLNRRVRSIMTLRLEGMTLVKKIVLGAFGFLAIAMPVAFGIVRTIPMYGQLLHASGTRPSFAVASIRPSQPDDPQGGSVQADSYVAKAKTIREIIEYAYGIGYDRELSGEPKWVSTDRYTILAKPDDAELDVLRKMSRNDRDEQMRLMVQSLLAERFGLKVSFVEKVLPVYALVLAKGGLKCASDEGAQPAIPDMSQPHFRWSEGPAPPPPPPGWTPPTPEESRRQAETTPLHMRTPGWPFWLVVTSLSHQPELDGRTVIDETGLQGSYDCQMSWSHEGSNGPGPSLFTAMQEQMGLKLEPTKRPVEVLVVDHVQRPESQDEAGLAEAVIIRQPSPPMQVAASQAPTQAQAVASAPPKSPEFEVATIRLAKSDARYSNLDLGVDRFKTSNVPLRFILQFAYNLNTGSNDQIVGAPSWIDTLRFDIEAKEDQELATRINAMSPEERIATLRRMTQVLLSERFGLTVHHETRELPVLALTVFKGQLKLTPATKSSAGSGTASASADGWSGLHNPGHGQTEGRDATIEMLVRSLSTKPEIGGRLVVDATGLQGTYNFKLNWTPDDGLATAGNSEAGGPSLFAALQEQLGLKLESRKAPVDCVVIDHVGMPSEN